MDNTGGYIWSGKNAIYWHSEEDIWTEKEGRDPRWEKVWACTIPDPVHNEESPVILIHIEIDYNGLRFTSFYRLPEYDKQFFGEVMDDIVRELDARMKVGP